MRRGVAACKCRIDAFARDNFVHPCSNQQTSLYSRDSQTEDEASDDDGMIEYVEDLDEEDEEDMEDMEMNAWDDDDSEEESEDDDDDESSEEESGSDDDESGSGSDDEDSDDEVNKKKKKPSAKPSKKQQPKKPKRGVRVEIEYEDENDAMMEEEGVSAGAGLAW